jgi:hypothetical protein
MLGPKTYGDPLVKMGDGDNTVAYRVHVEGTNRGK